MTLLIYGLAGVGGFALVVAGIVGVYLRKRKSSAAAAAAVKRQQQQSAISIASSQSVGSAVSVGSNFNV